MKAVYGGLVAVVLVVVFGLFSLQTSKTKAYTSGEGSHDIELVAPKDVYSKHNFQPKNMPASLDSLLIETVEDSVGQ